MYIIHEENHDCLCVAESIEKGVMWLINNDWLNGFTVGINEEDNEYYLVDVIGEEETIFGYVIKLLNKDGIRTVLEWLEQFGIYFNEIEVA